MPESWIMDDRSSERDLAERVEVVRADLTRERVDAIVNAANERLANGGGVARAIADAAGPELQRACDALVAESGPVPTGEAAATDAFALPCRKVIHAVGPVYGRHAGREAELLAAAHRSSIALAAGLGMGSVAFPAISCGIYGYPPELAAPTAVGAVQEALAANSAVEEARFVFLDEDLRSLFAQAAERK
jgi:O-acetyl-ADP-ribose deacetylase (regulator of RNase III)